MTSTPRDATGVRRMYYTPDGKQAADYAGFAQRLGGTIVDWIICFFLPFYFVGCGTSLAFGSGQSASTAPPSLTGIVIWLASVALSVVGYFSYFVARGRTIGMRIVGIQILDPSTARPPVLSRSLVRAFMALLLGAAVFMALNFALSDPTPDSQTLLYRRIGWAAVAIAVAGFWSHVWMLFDPRGQTAQDHIAGVVVVGTLVDVVATRPASAPSPSAPTSVVPGARKTPARSGTKRKRR